MQKINLALIGYGYWAKIHLKYLIKSKNFKLTKIYTRSKSKIKKDSFYIKNVNLFSFNLNKILSDPMISALIIVTPIDTHFKICQEAIKFNKNILIEKPLALNFKEAEKIKELSIRHNNIVHTAYTYIFSESLNFINTIIKKGFIGKLNSIDISIQQLGRFLKYDVILLLGSHCISILQKFYKIEKLEYKVFPEIFNKQILTSCKILIRGKRNSLKSTIDINLNSPIRNKRVVFFGSQGTIYFEPLENKTIKVFKYNKKEGKKYIYLSKTYSFNENDNVKKSHDAFFKVINKLQKSNINESVQINKIINKLIKDI